MSVPLKRKRNASTWDLALDARMDDARDAVMRAPDSAALLVAQREFERLSNQRAMGLRRYLKRPRPARA